MKKISLAIILLFFIGQSMVNAQIEKGKMLTGISTTFNGLGVGGGWYSSTKVKSDNDLLNASEASSFQFNLAPKIGYMPSEYFALGFNVYGMYAEETSGSFESSSKMIGVGPFLRLYTPGTVVKPYIELNGMFGSTSSSSRFNDWDLGLGNYDTKGTITTYGAGIGLAIPVGTAASFDIQGGYSNITMKQKEDNPDNTRVSMGTLGLTVGFTLYL